MKRHPGLLTALIGLALLAASQTLPAAAAQDRAIRIAQGELTGVTNRGVTAWKGIPFAAPPVGELRWKPPGPAPAWDGVREAGAYGPACLQPDRTDGGGVGRLEVQSEDCLNLNVWAPANAQDLPVMVWIHGGAHRLGAGSAPLYDGSELARQGVVAVTVNYRLGLLGFLAHPALTAAAAPDEPLGNYGLMDQIAALQWVRDNIAAFGGDPANVTVFGESAGGADILYHLTLPASAGLFHKAIVQSGGGMQRPSGLTQQEADGRRYAAAAGLGPNASLAEMKALPARTWIDAQGGLQGGLGFGPFIDGRLVSEPPPAVFAAGREHDVPLIIGANSNEASVLNTLGVPTAALAAAIGPRMDEFRPIYGDVDQAEFARQAMGDIVFVAPSRWVAAQAADGAPSYLYYFSYVPTLRRRTAPGAAHGAEIPFVFATWTGTALERTLSAEDRSLSRRMSACWTSFAKTGAPCEGWSAYDPQTDRQMEFGVRTRMGRPERADAFDIIIEQSIRAGR